MSNMAKTLGLENYSKGFMERLSSGEIKKLVLSNDSTTDYLTKDYKQNIEFFINVSKPNKGDKE